MLSFVQESSVEDGRGTAVSGLRELPLLLVFSV